MGTSMLSIKSVCKFVIGRFLLIFAIIFSEAASILFTNSSSDFSKLYTEFDVALTLKRNSSQKPHTSLNV